MKIFHRARALQMNAHLLSHHPLPNNSENPEGVGEIEIVSIFGVHVVDLESELFSEVAEGYKKCKDLNMVTKIPDKPHTGIILRWLKKQTVRYRKGNYGR